MTLLSALRNRETNYITPGTVGHVNVKKLNRFIYPNVSYLEVGEPAFYIRQFTPDGKYLVCYTKELNAMRVYQYHGPAVDTEKPQSIIPFDDDEELPSDEFENNALDVGVFGRFFTLKFETSICNTDGGRMVKDFGIFTHHGTIIVASTTRSSRDAVNTRRYPNSLKDIRHSDDVSFWIIDIESGAILDRKVFREDWIWITDHCGVHLYEDKLAITSLQHQCVYVLDLVNNYRKFGTYQTIGYFTKQDDVQEIAQVIKKEEETPSPQKPFKRRKTFHDYNDLTASTSPPQQQRPQLSRPTRLSTMHPSFTEPLSMEPPKPTYKPPMDCPILPGLHHRLITCIYDQILNTPPEEDVPKHHYIQHFHRHFAFYESLLLWKAVFFNKDTLILKFAPRDIILQGNIPRPTNSNIFDYHSRPHHEVHEQAYAQHTIIASYHIPTDKITQVVSAASEEFYNWCDTKPELSSPTVVKVASSDGRQVMDGRGLLGNSWTTSINNKYARSAVMRHCYTFMKAKNGGTTQAITRALCQLPVNSSSYHYPSTPYLDTTLFSSDIRTITLHSRTRPRPDFCPKFYDRETGAHLFEIEIKEFYDKPLAPLTPNNKLSISYIFHPTDPFIITQQNSSSDYHVQFLNIHTRKTTRLDPVVGEDGKEMEMDRVEKVIKIARKHQDSYLTGEPLDTAAPSLSDEQDMALVENANPTTRPTNNN